MELKAYDISLQIYSRSSEEAERGRQAIIGFIEKMKNKGVAVTGDKIVEAMEKFNSNPFAIFQAVGFFK